MKKNLTLNIEVFLPTNVTREIELPFFYVSRLDKYLVMISENKDSELNNLNPYLKTELKKYNDGEIARFITAISQNKLEQIIASIDPIADAITADEFLLLAKEYTNQVIEWFNNAYESQNN